MGHSNNNHCLHRTPLHRLREQDMSQWKWCLTPLPHRRSYEGHVRKLMVATPPQFEIYKLNVKPEKIDLSTACTDLHNQTCCVSLGRLHNCASGQKIVWCSYSLHILDFLDVSIMFPMFVVHIYLYTSTHSDAIRVGLLTFHQLSLSRCMRLNSYKISRNKKTLKIDHP